MNCIANVKSPGSNTVNGNSKAISDACSARVNHAGYGPEKINGDGFELLNIFTSTLQNVFKFNSSDYIPGRIVCDVIAPDIALVDYKSEYESKTLKLCSVLLVTFPYFSHIAFDICVLFL
jgi:hypothetical protein